MVNDVDKNNFMRRNFIIAWAEEFVIIQPTYCDRAQRWWLYDFESKNWVIKEEVEILNYLNDGLGLLKDMAVKRRKELLLALQMAAKKSEPKLIDKNIIQFGSELYDLTNGETTTADEKYFSPNKIPWKLGSSDATPTMDKLFCEWVGDEYVQTLYEIIAYCCYRDYPLHVIIVLEGSGRNGKSQLLKVVEKFLGANNITSTSLDELNRRFGPISLHNKLCGMMGETDHARLSRSDILKRLTGNDIVTYERKNVDAFTGRSYATLLMATNSLPISSDNTDGFYRRFVIISFPNEFPEGKDIVATIPDVEYENLARKLTKILPELLEKGKFTNEGSVLQKKLRYQQVSNPLVEFLERYCLRNDPNVYVSYRKLYQYYLQFLERKKRRRVTTKDFSAALDDLGIFRQKTTLYDSEEKCSRGDNWLWGIKFKRTIFEFEEKKPSMLDVPDIPLVPLSSTHIEVKSKYEHIEHIEHTDSEEQEFKQLNPEEVDMRGL